MLSRWLMQLSRARILVVGLDDPPRRVGRVRGREHRVLGPGVVDPLGPRAVTSIGQIFQRFVGSLIRSWNRRSCSSSLTENQYLIRIMPERMQHPLEFRAGVRRNSSYFASRAEAHDLLDAGAVVPAAVEHHHLAGGRQLRPRSAGSTTASSRVRSEPRARRRRHTRGLSGFGDALDRRRPCRPRRGPRRASRP